MHLRTPVTAPTTVSASPAAPGELEAQARAALQASDFHLALDLAQAGWDDSDDPASRRVFGQLAATAQYRLGRWSALLALGEALLPLLQSAQDHAMRQELLRWMTLGASEISRFDVALRCAHEAFSLALRGELPAAEPMALVGLAIVMERIGDPWQALRLLERARVIAERLDDPYALLVVANTLCATCIGVYYLLSGSHEDSDAVMVDLLQQARRHGETAQAQLARQQGPELFNLVIEANLGEIAVHLGDFDRARALLDSALRRAASHAGTPHAWRPRYSWGELLLAQGRAVEAADRLQGLLAEMTAVGAEHYTTRMRVHHGLYRAYRRMGQAEASLAQLEAFQALERARMVVQLKAQSEQFVTRMEAEQSRQEADDARQQAAELADAAQRDGLTGLGNRRLLDQRLQPLLDGATEHAPVSLAVLDLDHFKRVNDRHGHAVGDRALVALAGLLREHTREQDVVARLGGEEFVLVMGGTPLPRAQEVCERVRARVAGHDWSALAPGLSVTVSIGLAATPPREAQSLYERADAALYRAKAAGRNVVVAAADAAADAAQGRLDSLPAAHAKAG